MDAHDADQLVWSDFARRIILASPDAPGWLLALRERLGVPYSFMSILDEYLTDETRIAGFLDLNNRVISAVAREGKLISVERLQEIGVTGIRWAPYETQFIVDFSRGLASLIGGPVDP